VILEIRTFRLKPGRRGDFLDLTRHRSAPLLATYGIDLVDFGPPLVDEEPWEEAYVMRAYASLVERERLEAAFYGGDDWRLDLREAVMSCVESYHTVVIEVPDEVVGALTRPIAQS
jgi:NIPSNAP